MKKSRCPSCGKKIKVIETENKGELKFSSHRRWISHFEDESESGGHLRNTVDKVCESSGSVVEPKADQSNSKLFSMITHRSLRD